jgi:hypothetical protein
MSTRKGTNKTDENLNDKNATPPVITEASNAIRNETFRGDLIMRKTVK